MSEGGTSGGGGELGRPVLLFEPLDHEGEELGPGVEAEIRSESADVFEESFSCSEFRAEELVLFVKDGESGVKEESEQVEGDKKSGELIFSVPEVVL